MNNIYIDPRNNLIISVENDIPVAIGKSVNGIIIDLNYNDEITALRFGYSLEIKPPKIQY